MSFIDVSKLEYRKNVGMVLINAEGHIFAGKRLDNNTDAWQMPQGGIVIPKLWGGRYRGQKQKWFAFEFLGKDSDINIVTEEPEFSEWAWKSRDNLLSCVVPFKSDVYQRVFLELGHFVK
ncbi:MAG: RNA pyrophosphohydrolase [Rhodobacterales bacterium]|nr:RNA pyrophosphohydrolase [Rhodobacterales bacterium]